jgi:Cytochrome bd terminal oxidase subunit I
MAVRHHGDVPHDVPGHHRRVVDLLVCPVRAALEHREPGLPANVRFWRRIFAVGFAIGVVAGIVVTFEVGLNWGLYAARTGPIIGPIIGMEVVTAFFVEAGFIGILL